MEKILYVHVPKCGGTSISRAIKKTYFISKVLSRKKGIVPIYGEASRRSAISLNQSIGSHRISLAMYALNVSHNNIVLGHIPFCNEFYGISKEWNFVTLLRDPVERWYSEFYYTKKKFTNNLNKIPFPTEEYLESKPAKIFATNYMRHFSSIPELYNFNDVNDFNIENIDLNFAEQQAISNLKNFRVVGFLDNLDGFKNDFKKAFNKGLKIGYKNKGNTSKERQIPENIHNRVIELCKNDTRIYNSIKKHFYGEKQ